MLDLLARLRDMVQSLLPRRYQRWINDPLAGGVSSGLAQMLGGFATYAYLFFSYTFGWGKMAAEMMTTEGAAGLSAEQTSMGLGLVGYLSFMISPGPLAAMYCIIEGLARTISAGITREPLPSLPFWLIGAAHDGLDRLRARSHFDAPAPDIVETGKPQSRWDLRVTSVRAKTDWRAPVKVEYAGVLYEIVSASQHEEKGKHRFVYCLKKDTREIGAFRGIVHYDPMEFYRSQPE